MGARTCEVCGKRAARYVCQECGCEVCEACLEPRTWVCLNCYEQLRKKAPTLVREIPESLPWPTPFKLFLLGFLLIFIGIAFVVVASVFLGDSAGAMIWVPPFPPMIWGAGPLPYPIWAAILAVALTILGVILFFMARKQNR